MRKRRILISGTIIFLALVSFGFSSRILERKRVEKPNILIIIADDCTYNDLPLYGGKNAKTPNIDRLACGGLTFNQAFLAEAICQPCRSELYTGLYPLNNGCAWNHSASRPDIKSLPDYLHQLGYRVGLAGKVHVKPEDVYDFDFLSGFDGSCVRNPTQPHNTGAILEYMTEAKKGDPFCLVVALVEPHVPWVMGDPSQYPPENIELPPNHGDTPVTREKFGKYLAEISYMDSQVGEILENLEESGLKENTMVLFTSEQGSQFPGCKWTNWNTGVHTALVANDMDFYGQSFADVLSGKKNTHRQLVYTVHNNLPEGPPYPIRSLTDGEFHYIRNLRPDELYLEKHLMGFGALSNDYWDTWMAEQNDPGEPVDTREALEAGRKGNHLYGPSRKP